MQCHLPLTNRWEPDYACKALCDAGLNATLMEDEIVISFPNDPVNWPDRLRVFLGILDRCNHITIFWSPHHIINRIVIISHPPILWIQHEPQLTKGLRSVGVQVVGEDTTVRDIVTTYCRPSTKLLRKILALEELEAAAWRSDVDLADDWMLTRQSLVDEIEDLLIEQEDFCDETIAPDGEPSDAPNSANWGDSHREDQPCEPRNP